jgi:hypothetical protein
MRAVLTQDYDDRMGDAKATYRAVIFNPVPGPPMGGNTRLSFRYKIHGTGTLRVQLFSLSNGYHRYLTVRDLPRDQWREGCVDLREMRRPDGSGGALSADERIDDIQFYVDPRAELLIDDVALYEAAGAAETRPFPKRFVYTGWFDTGKQGAEWPGEFEIVPHEKPLTWKAARAVVDGTGEVRLQAGFRGARPTGGRTAIRFRYRLTGTPAGQDTGGANASSLQVGLVHSKDGPIFFRPVREPKYGEWTEAEVEGTTDGKPADGVIVRAPKGTTLLVDDVLVYEPG